MMSDICDGNYYRSHAIFSQCDKTLQIIAYYDELTLTNPLMSRRNEYKIGKLRPFNYDYNNCTTIAHFRYDLLHAWKC